MRFVSRRMKALVCLSALLFLALTLTAQQTLSVAKLQEFIKSSIQQKLADKDVALYLSKMKMSEKLSPNVVEDLQSAGAGPKTVAVLATLVTQSASLTAGRSSSAMAKRASVDAAGRPDALAAEFCASIA